MHESRPPAPLLCSTLAVASKELREGFRDRQTVMYTVVLPICLYPLLFWLAIQAALLIEGRRERTAVRVALVAQGAEVPSGLRNALEESPSAFPSAAEIEPLEIEEPRGPSDRASARAWLESRAESDEEHPDALLYLADAQSESAPSSLYFDSTASRSSLARARVEERLAVYAEGERHAAAERAGIDPAALDPLAVEERNVAAREDLGAYILSFVLPIVLVVMAVMGAFFPAVDLTAGERERGTAETTLLLPVPRLAVHQGKILAVACFALLATALNLLALGLAAGHLLQMLSAGGGVEIELPVRALLSIAPLALLFAFAISAVLTGVAALARSFKEGQALLGPVQIVFILPALAGALPGLELTPLTALIPVVNVVLAFRALLRGEEQPLEFALTALALLAFASLAIFLAVRVLSREEIQTGEHKLTLGRLARLLRAPTGA